MISWMEGFRKAYQMPKVWGLVKERLIAFQLVVMAGVPMGFASFLVVSGNLIERWTMYHVGHEFTPYILGLWTAVRWIIATLTSIAVIGLIYHHGVPRTQPWHRVLPGSVVLIGAEFNALRYPRFLFGAHSQLDSKQKSVAAL
jgi:uncharacterized BrkB/YihY/UPF0761 family membrane protein